MKRKLSPKKKFSNMHLLRIFLLGVLTLLLISVITKFTEVAQKSLFDGSHRFTVAILYAPSIVKVFSFSPEDNSESILTIHTTKEVYQNLEDYIAVPIDALIKDSNIPPNIQNPSDLFFSLNFKFGLHTSLTKIDIFRLWFFARNVAPTDIQSKEISSNLDSSTIDTISSSFFKDNTVESENKNIQIINETNVTGLGNRLSRIVSNSGGNVVSVKTNETVEKHSVIEFSGNRGYTTEKLIKITGYNAIPMQKKSFADIIILIGQDRQNSESF